MKLRITAIAAGLLALSGAASAAEVLNVAQMDTVTAGGGWRDAGEDWGWKHRGWHGHDKYGDKWQFGKYKVHGEEYSARCKRDDGGWDYGKVKEVYKPEPKDKDKTPPPPPPPTNTATQNITVNVGDGNTNVVIQIAALNQAGNNTGTVTDNNTGDISQKIPVYPTYQAYAGKHHW